MNLDRRDLIRGLYASAVFVALPGCSLIPNKRSLVGESNFDNDWAKAEQIRSAIVRPTFAQQDLLLTDYLSNDFSDCTQAFQQAVKQCNQSGGGRVVVPEGVYYTGPIHLLSNVNLHLEKGAVIKFIPDPERYLPAVFTRWEGMEMMGYSPLIYAYRQRNIAITGEGILDGCADNQTWWPWKGAHKEAHWQLIKGEDQKPARQALMADVEAGVPVEKRLYADGSFLRPSFIQPYQCEKVLVEGVTITNAPFWLLHPVLCQHVTVKKVSFLSHGPNSDGCDPESCDHVLIEDCTFDTGDDCIAIKSGRNADGRRLNQPSQNIVIANCLMREGHGGVVIGSEISGGVNNVFVENCQMDSPELERAIRIKTNSVRGGLIEHLRYRNITVGTVQTAIVINFYYEEGDAGDFDPTVRDIVVEGLVCQNVTKRALNLQGFPHKSIGGIQLINSHFYNSNKRSIVANVNNLYLENVTENGKEVQASELFK